MPQALSLPEATLQPFIFPSEHSISRIDVRVPHMRVKGVVALQVSHLGKVTGVGPRENRCPGAAEC